MRAQAIKYRKNLHITHAERKDGIFAIKWRKLFNAGDSVSEYCRKVNL